jgi:hypothetical protein
MRDKLEIQKRAASIHKATPNILEELYEMQNRKCDLCGNWIQDLIFAALDHSIPVIKFARNLDIPIEEAIKQANDPPNLRAVHSLCNSQKWEWTRDEWFAKGMDKKVGKLRTWNEEEIEEFKKQFLSSRSPGGKVSGPIVGKNHAKNKTGACGRSPEKMSEDGRKAGIIARDTGQLASIAPRGGRAAKEKKVGIFSPGYDRSTGPRISGHNQFKNKTGIFARTPEQMTEDGRKAASIANKNKDLNGKSLVAVKSTHKRWHKDRGIINPNCSLCIEAIQNA